MAGMTDVSQEPLAQPVRVADLGDLLAGLPVLFGFRPTDSLVAICIEEPRGRVGFRLRVDLPPPDHVGQAADHLLGVLRRNAAEVVLVVACSDQPSVADPMVTAMVERLRSAGVQVRDAVRCDGSRYWSYDSFTAGFRYWLPPAKTTPDLRICHTVPMDTSGHKMP